MAMTTTRNDLELMRAGLVRYLAGRVGPDGRVRCPCRSRVLESVLALCLLQEEGNRADDCEWLRAYLSAAAAESGLPELDSLLIRAALDGRKARRASPADLLDDLLDDFEHHTAGRKEMLLETLLYLVGAIRKPSRRSPDDFLPDGLHSWKRAEMSACKIINAHATGQEDQIDPADVTRVAEALRSDGIYERNQLAHLIFLFAMRRYPAHDHVVREGIDRLLAIRNHDGGFSLTENIDVWVTSVCGLALAEQAGARRHGDAWEQAVKAADWIAAQQHDNGGWSYTVGVGQTDTDCAYYCLWLLRLTGPGRHAHAITRGHAYLRAIQNQDGGFPIYVQGNPSEAAMTGGALSVLAAAGDENAPQIEAGAEWLIAAQNPDGTFERNWSLSEGNAIFRAVHGLRDALERDLLPPATARGAVQAVRRGTRYLVRTQNPDGGWGHRPGKPSDPISTGYAIGTLGLTGASADQGAAMAFLRRRQADNGGFPCAPDTVSPRPFALDLPDLAHAYVLRGLTLVRTGDQE